MPNGNINELPLWAKFIAYLGFPIAVATLLLWVVVKQLETHNALLLLHDARVEQHTIQTFQHSSEMHEAVRRLTYIMQTMCQNTSRTKEDAGKCLEKP